MLLDATIVFAWAVAEATFWPFMPDAAIVPLAAWHPIHSWLLIPVAVAGSAIGGCLSFFVGRRFQKAEALLTKLPFVRASMLVPVREWFVNEGPRGARHQPLSTIPFKVFAVVAGQMNLPVVKFMSVAMLVRALRFSVVLVMGEVFGMAFPSFVAQFAGWLLLLWSVAFYVILVMTLRKWKRADGK